MDVIVSVLMAGAETSGSSILISFAKRQVSATEAGSFAVAGSSPST